MGFSIVKMTYGWVKDKATIAGQGLTLAARTDTYTYSQNESVIALYKAEGKASGKPFVVLSEDSNCDPNAEPVREVLLLTGKHIPLKKGDDVNVIRNNKAYNVDDYLVKAAK